MKLDWDLDGTRPQQHEDSDGTSYGSNRDTNKTRQDLDGTLWGLVGTLSKLNFNMIVWNLVPTW
jgi:hypothetical protein